MTLQFLRGLWGFVSSLESFSLDREEVTLSKGPKYHRDPNPRAFHWHFGDREASENLAQYSNCVTQIAPQHLTFLGGAGLRSKGLILTISVLSSISTQGPLKPPCKPIHDMSYMAKKC